MEKGALGGAPTEHDLKNAGKKGLANRCKLPKIWAASGLFLMLQPKLGRTNFICRLKQASGISPLQ
jgi:hypothetical protein